MPNIVEKETLTSQIVRLKVMAPTVAEKRKPGHFVILRVHELKIILPKIGPLPSAPQQNCTRFKGHAGAVLGIILCLVDVTKSKKAEEGLLEANRALEALKNRLTKENTYLQEEIKVSQNFDHIIGESDAVMKVLRQVSQVSFTDATVLILGETGTGKELIARAIHSASGRNHKPLIKIDCASITNRDLWRSVQKGTFRKANTSETIRQGYPYGRATEPA